MSMTLSNLMHSIAELPDGAGETVITGLNSDSRLIRQGDVFAALAGVEADAVGVGRRSQGLEAPRSVVVEDLGEAGGGTEQNDRLIFGASVRSYGDLAASS